MNKKFNVHNSPPYMKYEIYVRKSNKIENNFLPSGSKILSTPLIVPLNLLKTTKNSPPSAGSHINSITRFNCAKRYSYIGTAHEVLSDKINSDVDYDTHTCLIF